MDKTERTAFRAIFDLVLNLEDQLEMQGEHAAGLERNLDDLRKQPQGADTWPGLSRDYPGDLISMAGVSVLVDHLADLRITFLREVAHIARDNSLRMLIARCEKDALLISHWITRLRDEGIRVKMNWENYTQEVQDNGETEKGGREDPGSD